MSEQSQIGFEQIGIGALLKSYKLVVPPNQRDYAWEKEQVQTLLEDIAYAMSQDESNYFLGTIVTVPKNDGVLEVIDGQQRLATVSLAYASLRYRSNRNIQQLSRAIEPFLWKIDNNTLDESPNMDLNTFDSSVFHSLIKGSGPGTGFKKERVSHINLKMAFDSSLLHWKKIVEPFADQNAVEVYKKWMNYIQYNAKVILLKVPTNINAFKMFETLNDRGLKTSQADLVKNYILGESGSDLPSAQEKWGFIKSSLESIEEDDVTVNFLRQALICQCGYIKEAQVYERVQSMVKGRNTAIDFLNIIENQARDYSSIFNYSNSRWNRYPSSVRKSLEALNLFNIKPFRPLILAVIGKFDERQVSSALQGMVSLGVRLIIAASTRSGSVEQPIANVAKDVFDARVISSSQLFTCLKNIIPSDEAFRESFAIATVSNQRFARYYIRSIEMALSQEKEPWFIPNEDALHITLEHILPMKPEGNWNQFTVDDVKGHVKRIGNMTLLPSSVNSFLRSDEFEKKSKVFREAPYKTTSMIADYSEWTKEAIDDRQKKLASASIQAWPHPLHHCFEA